MNNHRILAANCQRPITDEEKDRYSVLKGHYEERMKSNVWRASSEGNILWMKIHLRYIKKVLESGMIGSYEN